MYEYSEGAPIGLGRDHSPVREPSRGGGEQGKYRLDDDDGDDDDQRGREYGSASGKSKITAKSRGRSSGSRQSSVQRSVFTASSWCWDPLLQAEREGRWWGGSWEHLPPVAVQVSTAAVHTPQQCAHP